MTEKFFQLKSFITYWLDAVDAHSLHSPFFYRFYTEVVQPKQGCAKFSWIEKIRSSLLSDSRILNVLDLGSGSQVIKKTLRPVRDITRTSLSQKHYSYIYARLASYFQCKTIFDLGTSFGINTLYLSIAEGSTVTTFEGSVEIAEIAYQSFEYAHAKNIRMVTGNLDDTLLPEVLSVTQIDLAFMDANHRSEPTLRYFNCLVQRMNERSIVIVDDIHYSQEMEYAWNKLKRHERVHASADLYRCGILFFDPSLNNQHVVLQC